MSQQGSSTRDARTAWAAWSVDGQAEAASEFLERVEAWTDGTAAQLARASTSQPPASRDRVADRLRHHIGLIADGEPVPYLDALNLARHQVLKELRPDR